MDQKELTGRIVSLCEAVDDDSFPMTMSVIAAAGAALASGDMKKCLSLHFLVSRWMCENMGEEISIDAMRN